MNTLFRRAVSACSTPSRVVDTVTRLGIEPSKSFREYAIGSGFPESLIPLVTFSGRALTRATTTRLRKRGLEPIGYGSESICFAREDYVVKFGRPTEDSAQCTKSMEDFISRDNLAQEQFGEFYWPHHAIDITPSPLALSSAAWVVRRIQKRLPADSISLSESPELATPYLKDPKVQKFIELALGLADDGFDTDLIGDNCFLIPESDGNTSVAIIDPPNPNQTPQNKDINLGLVRSLADLSLC